MAPPQLRVAHRPARAYGTLVAMQGGMNHDAGSRISAELIRTQGRELQGFDLSPARATELAAEVARIQERMADVTPGFWFFDEPVQFLAVLDELAAGDE